MPLSHKTNRRWMQSVLDAVAYEIPTRVFPSQVHATLLAQPISKATAMQLKATMAGNLAAH